MGDSRMSNEIYTSKMQNIAEQTVNGFNNALGRMHDMNTIKVDTSKLDYYSNRLRSLNRQLTNVDLKLDSLLLKVDIGDKVNVIKADLSIGYNFKIAKCASYLDNCADRFRKVEKTLCGKDPLYFTKPLTKRISDEGLFGVIGKATKTGAEKVKSAFDYTCQFIGEGIYKLQSSYYDKGTVYKIFQIGKAVGTTAKGAAKMFKGIVEVLTGVGIPLGVLSIASGFNDLYNGVNHIFDAAEGKYDQLKTNLFKDYFEKQGTKLGRYSSNEEAGANLGKGLYYSMDFISSLFTLSSFNFGGRLIQMEKPNMKVLGSELSNWFTQYKGYIQDKGVIGFLKTNLDQIIYDLKLSGFGMTETKNITSFIPVIYKHLKDGYKVLDKGIDTITAALFGNTGESKAGNFFEKFTEGIDCFKDMIGKSTSVGKKILTTVKYVFN